jgi:hypothetical protein
MTGGFANTHYQLPQGANVDEAMSIVEQHYFREDRPLSEEEYQSFIFLTYAELTLQLCETLNISLLEAGCKDDIDRGSVFKAVLMLHYLHKRQELTPQKLEEIMVNLLAPALIVAKRAPVPHRSKFVRYIVDNIIPIVQE